MTTPSKSPYAPDSSDSRNQRFSGNAQPSGSPEGGYQSGPVSGGYSGGHSGRYPGGSVPGGSVPGRSVPGGYHSGPVPGSYSGGYPPQRKAGSNKLVIILPIVIVVLALVVSPIIWFWAKGSLFSSVSDGPQEFGGTYTWEDGMAVTVSMPEPYVPGELAAIGVKHNPVKLQVTVYNGGETSIREKIIVQSMESRGQVSKLIWDTDFENDIEYMPEVSLNIPAGEAFTWWEAYDVQNTRNMKYTFGRFDEFVQFDAVFILE